jgi:hypothetical protein
MAGMTAGRYDPRGLASSFTSPRPVRWSADRDERGASAAPQGPRCTVPGCPVRYAGGPDRPCRDHAAEDERDQADARAWSLASMHTGSGHRWPACPAWPAVSADGEAITDDGC